MARILISYVFPFVLPTAMYFLWAMWVRKKIMAERAAHHTGEGAITAQEVESYEIRAPWLRLILSGLALVVIGLLLGVLFSPKNPPGSVYQPPHMENGRVVPGQFAPPSAPAQN